MKIMKKLKSALSILLGGVILVSYMPAAFQSTDAAVTASVCTIDTSTQYQTIRGFGGMNHPEWIGDLTSAQRETAFGNGDNQLGMTMVRIYINDDKNQWNKAVATAKYAQQNGAIVFATPWNPPASMCETFTRTYKTWDGKTQTQANQKRLRHDKYADYANHLNDFYHFMKNNGVELYSISIQNEPDYGSDWTWMTEAECVDFLANYADKIDCPVMSPESFSYNKSYYNAILNNAKANANTDIFGTHFYGTSRENMDFPVLENDKRELFMTEVYTDSKNDADLWPMALDVSENIHNGLVVGNMNAYVWWYIRRSYGPMKEDGTLSKRGYCMAQYSKFVRPGDVRVAATEQPTSNVYISAYKNSNNQATVVAVNKGTEGYAQQFSLAQNITDIDRYRTSSNENLAKTENLEHENNSFWAQLPAQSVSTFVITLDGGSTQPPTEPPTQAPVEPDENGYYFHDTFEGSTFDWTEHGSADVLLSGRSPYKGTEALLIQTREKEWNGAQKILSSAFKAGQEYSFSVCVNYLDGESTYHTIKLSLQYTDSNGDTKYASIASTPVVKGKYAQLENTNFKLPDGGSNFIIYVESIDGIDNFYIDEAIGAKAGIVVEGPEPAEIPTEPTFLLGDITCDGIIDCFDLIAAKKVILGSSFASTAAEKAADVNNDDVYNIADTILIQQFILNKFKSFPVA